MNELSNDGRLEMYFPDISNKSLDGVVLALLDGDGDRATRLLGTHKEQRKARRDKAFAEFKAHCFAHETTHKAARDIFSNVARYQATRWRDKRRQSLNPEPENSLNYFCWKVLKYSENPPKESRIRQILTEYS